MNIAVTTSAGDYYFRPDSTLNRESEDYYCPNDITGLVITPCLYTKISKSAKAVGNKFAPRYCNCFDFGIMIDAVGLEHGVATSMDCSSILPCSFTDISDLQHSSFHLVINGIQMPEHTIKDATMIYDAIVNISRKSTLRQGDFVAILLPERHEIYRGDTIIFNGKEIRIL